MKKIFALILTSVMALTLLAGCGASGKTLEEVKEAGKLVVATSPDFPPFENLENGEIVGIEVDLMNKICEQLGVELVLESMSFESVLLGIQAGKYDVGMSGITVDEDRSKNMLFTDAYCLAAQAIVVKADSPIATKADLTGKSIAVQTATTAEKFCMDAGYDVKAFEANSDAQAALTTGKVDAWVIDDLTAADMVAVYNANNEDQLVILSEAMTTEPYAFAFAFGSEDLVAEVNKILATLIEDGSVEAAFEKFNAPYTPAK